MSDRRVVPIAYVTKWSMSVGIRIVRDAEVTDGCYLYKSGRYASLHVSAAHWSEDKAEAEKRYRFELAKAKNSAERKLDALKRKLADAPKYTEG